MNKMPKKNDFALMCKLYKEWNEKINVISRKDIDNLYDHHILHSLALNKYMEEKGLLEDGLEILDLGTGGGFPGIPLASVMPSCHFTLCDSIAKKVRVAQAVAKDLKLKNVTCVNARAETAGEKPSFREGWAAHRCVIPASWYYEWEHVPSPSGRQKAGDKYAIMARGGEITWLCGLYRFEDNYPHFVILTREPGASISFIHDRMPFVLSEAEAAHWIDPTRNPHLLLDSAITDMAFEMEKPR